MSFMGYVQSLWGPSTPSTAAGSAPTAPARHGSTGGASAQQLGSGVWPLSPQVREEMKKGTRYNMKVILRGTKGTGKSTLLARLTGHPLPLTYTPSTEIVASTMRLQGEETAPAEGVKVDLWEVVEEGRQRSASSSSPNTTAKATRHIPSAQLQEALRVAADARLLDVYAGAHLTIFLIDPRQRASWDYARQETLHVPPTCCVLYALNFADVVDVALPSVSGGVVSLAEVQAWCGRVRRATTNVVHRMLEGRQAPENFSVRPMTAVLSARSGAGVMGVLRALHVASTLLRIAVEEVRVVRLFELAARQQAVIIRDDVVTPPSGLHGTADRSGAPPPHEGEGANNNNNKNNNNASPALSSALPNASRGVGAGGSGQMPPAAPQPLTLSSSPLPSQPTGSSVASAAAPAAAAASTTALRMEHRQTPSSSSAAVTASTTPGPRGQLLLANPSTRGAAPGHALSEAEAMKLFLGGSSSSSSAASRSSSSSTSSAVQASLSRANFKAGAVLQAPSPRLPAPVIDRKQPTADAQAAPFHAPPATELREGVGQATTLEAVSAQALSGSAEHAQEGHFHAVEGTGKESTGFPPPATVGPGPPSTAHLRAPEEEVMRALTTTIIHDADAPTDDFFQERSTSPPDAPPLPSNSGDAEPKSPSLRAEASMPQPDASKEEVLMISPRQRSPSGQATSRTESMDTAVAAADGSPESGLRARPLWTQRVVRKLKTVPPTAAATATHNAASPALQAEVSTILAEMTAALSAPAAAAPSPPPPLLAAPSTTEANDDGTRVRHSRRTTRDDRAQEEHGAGESVNEDAVKEKKKKSTSSSKHHRHSRDRASERREHGRHRKHREHRSANDPQQHASEGQSEENMEDDGSFELVIT